jgi:hypothetical protein
MQTLFKILASSLVNHCVQAKQRYETRKQISKYPSVAGPQSHPSRSEARDGCRSHLSARLLFPTTFALRLSGLRHGDGDGLFTAAHLFPAAALQAAMLVLGHNLVHLAPLPGFRLWLTRCQNGHLLLMRFHDRTLKSGVRRRIRKIQKHSLNGCSAFQA